MEKGEGRTEEGRRYSEGIREGGGTRIVTVDSGCILFYFTVSAFRYFGSGRWSGVRHWESQNSDGGHCGSALCVAFFQIFFGQESDKIFLAFSASLQTGWSKSGAQIV
jgi:hypothetical protein